MRLSRRLNQNHLLSALPSEEYDRVVSHLELVPMALGDILYEPGKTLQHAYFPSTSIVSLYYTMESGASTEAAAVGNEGVLGASLFMGGDSAPSTAMVQCAGYGYRLERQWLKVEFRRAGAFQSLLLRHTQSLITHMTLTAGCTRHHTIAQQMCRWLLSMCDRMPTNEISMTQELVSKMLGVRRESVTEIANRLQHAGIIQYRRGHISILDRLGLENFACECYAILKRELDKLLSDIRLPDGD